MIEFNFLRPLSFIFLFSLTACGQSSQNQATLPAKTEVREELIVDKLTNPWGLEFLPDGSLLISEKEGKLIRFKDGKKTEISGVPRVFNSGQGGLLDLKLHPDYAKNGWLYFTYSSPEGSEEGAHTAIARAKIKGNALDQLQVLYKATPNTTKAHHFGSRIAFDKQGFLYFSIGERGDRDINPQDINRDGGKIYRLNDDGSIPLDNPFVGKPGLDAIYSYGHRNPQGLALNYNTGEIWEHEHGPRGGDEINIIKKGANYGWRVITYGINYDGTPITDKTTLPGMTQPIHYWVPSIAPSGMAFVSSDCYPNWKGSLLVGSLAFQYLEHLTLNGTKVVKRERLMDKIGRVRNVKQGPDGYIYVGVEGKGIYRLVPVK